MESENSGSDTTINTAYDITGEAQLNGDCVYEADEIDLIERRRIDKYKLMLLTTSSQMGHEWPNCSKSWPRQDQSKCLMRCIANMEGSLVLITFRSVSNSGHELPNAGGFDRSTAVAVIITKHLYLLHSPIQFWCN
jgi:hypothetical protein